MRRAVSSKVLHRVSIAIEKVLRERLRALFARRPDRSIGQVQTKPAYRKNQRMASKLHWFRS
jgi:hypothetical protein